LPASKMSLEDSVVELTLESDLSNVEVAEEVARRIATTAGFGEEDQHRIDLAVHETVINAIAHGNKSDPHKQVRLRFQIHSDRLEIRIRDQGSGFDPRRVADPLADQNVLRVSGRGVFLTRTFMDDYRVETPPGGGTEVILVKRLNSNNSVPPRRKEP